MGRGGRGNRNTGVNITTSNRTLTEDPRETGKKLAGNIDSYFGYRDGMYGQEASKGWNDCIDAVSNFFSNCEEDVSSPDQAIKVLDSDFSADQEFSNSWEGAEYIEAFEEALSEMKDWLRDPINF